ncbi:HlyC/CorC family transporter [candidate division KSB1 bacterium]|nr:HlyC/CorC family transporter [candidate division KSB1 bacterium]
MLTWMMIFFVVGILFSAIETAFTAFDRILIDSWERGGRLGIPVLRFLAAHPDRFLSTTLIGNNLSNVGFTFVLVAMCEQWGLSDLSTTLVSACSSIIVLIFSEILPKQIAYASANRIVRPFSWPLMIGYVAFSPMRWLLAPLTRLIPSANSGVALTTEQRLLAYQAEFEQVLTGAEAAGAATPEEGELLSRYLDARELKVRDIMTPRTELVAVDISSTVHHVRALFERHRHNVLPIYQGDLDHILGYVRARDFLTDVADLRAVVRPIPAVPESKHITELLQEFRTGRRHIAVVIDEYGGTDGLVTIKDIFEELVGPVAERWDPDEPIVRRTAPGKFLVSGGAFLEDIEAETGWQPPEMEANTLSGLLSEYLGRIPEAGEDIVMQGVSFRVIRRSPRRVEGCLMKLRGHLPGTPEPHA